eukprot:m.63187 g.63187  ORF g.63187 m.63187 type:complete len:109 (-) comp11568_c0_seq1:3027-3353(-)
MKLKTDDFFIGRMERDIAERLLNKMLVGTFMVRTSPRNNLNIISVKLKDAVKHFQLLSDERRKLFVAGKEKRKFKTLEDLVKYYRKKSISMQEVSLVILQFVILSLLH